MAYSKTTWQNNVTDVDENSLNKIEQGIYDNSLVVDAVTNTLNPTDTETYKTAELTEGQITDVIGVNDIVIKGQTSQNGEPTPSSPVDVNVVSGSNVVNTSNKNLLKCSQLTQTISGVTFTKNNDGTYTVNGTATALITFNLISNSFVLLAGTYTISGCPSGGSDSKYRLDINNGADANQKDYGLGKTFTLTDDYTVENVRIRIASGATLNNLIFKPQIEQGSTATTYEPHQGKELPLDLPVENLMALTNSTNTDGGITRVIENGVIKLSGTPESTSYNRTIFTFTATKTGQYMLLPYKSSTNSNIRFIYKINDGSFMNNDDNLTMNLTKNDVVTINLRISSTDIINNFTLKPMLYLGTKVNAFYPYGTDPIELCKIGNYQDYFYKSGSKWYLHKEIEKLELDGTENWNAVNRIDGTTKFFVLNLEKRTKVLATQITTGELSNKFIQNNPYTEIGDYFWAYDNGSITVLRIGLNDDTITTAQQIKAWIGNNNFNVYYPLKEPTDTEITDTTLISQLEAIYNAPLYEQTNITQENNDLPMILDITACKDNINGIKAFIRK